VPEPPGAPGSTQRPARHGAARGRAPAGHHGGVHLGRQAGLAARPGGGVPVGREVGCSWYAPPPPSTPLAALPPGRPLCMLWAAGGEGGACLPHWSPVVTLRTSTRPAEHTWLCSVPASRAQRAPANHVPCFCQCPGAAACCALPTAHGRSFRDALLSAFVFASCFIRGWGAPWVCDHKP
jgi:hypothetical protein